MYLAENLKTLRKSKDMTQEEIAEIIGVSPQSVSKWERGDTFPDITLLPTLANLYNTSIDSLIGMEKINDDKALSNAFLEGQRFLRDDDNAKAAEVFEKALKIYPNDESLMLELALVYAIDGETEKLGKAEALCQRIMSGKPTNTVQATARAVQCYIHLKSGDKEKAVETAQSLPHEAVCRSTVLDKIEKNPSTDEINKYLSTITFRDNAEHDTLVIDFGIDMIPMVEECDLLEKITEARRNAGKDKKGRDKIPPVRVRDNTELAPTQVRLRYYSDYLLNKQFTDNTACVDELITILQNL